jgi:hypothetical protein
MKLLRIYKIADEKKPAKAGLVYLDYELGKWLDV